MWPDIPAKQLGGDNIYTQGLPEGWSVRETYTGHHPQPWALYIGDVMLAYGEGWGISSSFDEMSFTTDELDVIARIKESLEVCFRLAEHRRDALWRGAEEDSSRHLECVREAVLGGG